MLADRIDIGNIPRDIGRRTAATNAALSGDKDRVASKTRRTADARFSRSPAPLGDARPISGALAGGTRPRVSSRIWRAQLRVSAFDQTSHGSATRQGCSAGRLAAGCSCRARRSAGASSNQTISLKHARCAHCRRIKPIRPADKARQHARAGSARATNSQQQFRL